MRIWPALALAALVAACAPVAREQLQAADTAQAAPTSAADETLPPDPERRNLRTFLRGSTPPDLPSYLPLYRDAKVVGGFERPPRFGGGGSVIFTTAAPPADVIAWYRKTTAAANFAESASNANGGTLTYAARAGRRSIQVIAEPVPGGAHVQIFWTGVP